MSTNRVSCAIAFGLLVFAFVLNSGLAAAGIVPDVEVKTTFPAEVHVDLMPPVKDNGFVNQKFHVTLKNNSGKDLLLMASNPCTVSDWQILEASGNANQVKAKADFCIQVLVTHLVKPGETLAADDVARIDGKLLKDGASYKFRYKFFGYEAESNFKAAITH
jgi:hypothetical protein